MTNSEKKTRSTYQSHVNRLRNRCNEYQAAIHTRNRFIAQMNRFTKVMLEEGKITKEDLKPYFKKRREQ